MAIGGIPHFQTHPQGTMVFRRLSKADHGRLLIVVEALPGYTRNVIIALGDISGIGICSNQYITCMSEWFWPLRLKDECMRYGSMLKH